MKYASTILNLIGNTPLIKINKLKPKRSVDIYAKMEGFNPGGSVKDRIALRMIEDAERKGILNKDKIIIEPTSGNTGIGLAMVAAVKGYRCVFVMPASVSVERILILKALGAKVILTPPSERIDGAIRKAEEMISQEPEKYYMPDQFSNYSNPIAHYYGTGREIWEDTDGKLTHFVAGLGTTGTIMGAGKFLKEMNPSIKLIGVEPEKGHKIQGLKNMSESIVPKIFDPLMLDEIIHVSTVDAYKWALRLTREEGIFVGQSSGAAFYAAYEVGKKIDEGLIVVIFPDMGFKYASVEPYFNEEVVKLVEKARNEERVIEI
ncbi:MAG: PLP-dependent cysteine synthase family protein [Candidatus Asgardarchaeia archaeon]